MHNYKGSLVESYVNEFVYDLEDKGYTINTSGIMDKDDLYKLGFVSSVTVSGRPYLCDVTPDFVKFENNYWLGGYYRVDTYQWVYFDEKIDTKNCDEEYGVRPVISIEFSETIKNPQTNTISQEDKTNLKIKDLVSSNNTWVSEGGIHNPYDKYYFDCEKMIFKHIFESSELTYASEYAMIFVDDKTIQVEGIRMGYDVPAQITIVNETKLRVRFLERKYNEGDYFLRKED